MSQQILRHPVALKTESKKGAAALMVTYLPAAISIIAAFALTGARLYFGGSNFISDGALMMLALAAYLIAAVFFLTNLYAPFRFAERLGGFAATVGVFLNLASWLVRWVAAYDRELEIFRAQGADLADMPWLFRYVPFANLYDLSVAFAFGAGITTLLVMRNKQFRVVATLSLPLAAIILVLARFIGDQLIDLPPVLDSYWRPIHVGIASISYGVALVCFAVAVLYLLKDGLQVEKMAIWTSIFALGVFATISKFSVFSLSTFGTYTASTFLGSSRSSIALRADIPYVGWIIVGAAAFLLLSIAFSSLYITRRKRTWQRFATGSLIGSLILQGTSIAVLVYQLRSLTDIPSLIDRGRFERFAVWMMQQQDIPQQQINSMGQQQLFDMANTWVTQNASQLQLSLNANPVELAALITAFTGTFFVLLFGFQTEKLRTLLPAAEKLDELMYKLAGVAFAGLALLLITGAVWANESWGRYWGWDAKEVGALVAWLTYAGFLHSRLAYGWRGRSSSYFAILAFLFIIFTYLGVSYLLPGLHSYA